MTNNEFLGKAKTDITTWLIQNKLDYSEFLCWILIHRTGLLLSFDKQICQKSQLF